MGVLDDAIRDHLELKRRHGADAGELERLEQEAFGPVTREPPGPAPQPDAAPEPVEPDVEPSASEAPLAGQADVPEDWVEDGPGSDDEAEPEAARGGSVSAGLGAAPPAAPADDPSGDVLEETPEFLEETPEHDRLWFEQKPPKDFDF